MIEMKRFQVLMNALIAAYPRWSPAPGTHEIFYQICSDLDADHLQAAILSWVSSDTPWPPSAGQLRNLAFELLESDSGVLSAPEAWGEVVKHFGISGHNRTPEFSSDTITAAVKAIGGWRWLCLSPEESLVSSRARFTTAYETIQKRERDTQRMLPAVREVVKRLTDMNRPRLIHAGTERDSGEGRG